MNKNDETEGWKISDTSPPAQDVHWSLPIGRATGRDSGTNEDQPHMIWEKPFPYILRSTWK